GLPALRHDALGAELAYAGVEGTAVAFDVVDGADRSRRRHQAQEQLLALDQGERTQVEVLEREQVEEEQRRGQLGGRPLDVPRRRQQRALLQPLEDGSAGIVQLDDLSVGADALRMLYRAVARQSVDPI